MGLEVFKTTHQQLAELLLLLVELRQSYRINWLLIMSSWSRGRALPQLLNLFNAASYWFQLREFVDIQRSCLLAGTVVKAFFILSKRAVQSIPLLLQVFKTLLFHGLQEGLILLFSRRNTSIWTCCYRLIKYLTDSITSFQRFHKLLHLADFFLELSHLWVLILLRFWSTCQNWLLLARSELQQLVLFLWHWHTTCVRSVRWHAAEDLLLLKLVHRNAQVLRHLQEAIPFSLEVGNLRLLGSALVLKHI